MTRIELVTYAWSLSVFGGSACPASAYLTLPILWSQDRDSNPGPTRYECVALPPELSWHISLSFTLRRVNLPTELHRQMKNKIKTDSLAFRRLAKNLLSANN